MSLELICQDSLPWLRAHRDVGSIITSMPDADEVDMELEEWHDWFLAAAFQCMCSTSEKACTIFYQTDRKARGQHISKAQILFDAAKHPALKMRCLWHKIVLRHEIGMTDMYRPGFTHLIAFSRAMKVGTATPDVMHAGKFLHRHAAGIDAARFAVEYARRADNRMVDPFCGFGTFPLIANALDMHAIGIDIDKHRIAICRSAQTQLNLI